jgi:hypothetical protein
MCVCVHVCVRVCVCVCGRLYLVDGLGAERGEDGEHILRVTVVSQWRHSGVTVVSPWLYSSVTVVLQ